MRNLGQDHILCNVPTVSKEYNPEISPGSIHLARVPNEQAGGEGS